MTPTPDPPAGPAADTAAPAPQRGNPEPFHFPGDRRVGVLLVHGWSGSPAEMRGLGQYLAGQGLTVSGVRLPGHGTDARELQTVTWPQWVAACGQRLTALQQTCERVFIAGLSMGGLLSLYVAATARPPVAGVVAMSAPIYFKNWQITVLPVAKHAVRWHTKGPSDLIDPTAQERLWHYPRVPTHSIHQMSVLAREVRRLLPRLAGPLLIMQGRHDRTIHPGCGAYLYEHAGSADKALVYYENSGHGIVEDTEREAVWARAYEFIRAHAPAPAG